MSDTIKNMTDFMGSIQDSTDISTALESLLCPDCVQKLLDQVKSNIEVSCKTIEDCDAMANKVKDEASKFNACLDTMAEAARGFKAGTISKEELGAKINPCIAELRASCDVLKFEKCCDDSQDVTDEDITNLRAFIVGVRDLIAKKRSDLGDATTEEVPAVTEPDEDTAIESLNISSLLNMDVAEEGSITFILRQKFGFDAKETKEVIKEANAKAKAKDFDGAIALYKKAKGMYEKALKKIESIPDKKEAMMYREKDKEYTTDSVSKTAAINSFKSKIFKMTDRIDKLTQAKKKAVKKATESFDIFDELGVEPATESIDIYDALEVSPALEEALDALDDDDESLEDILEDAVDEPEDNDHIETDPNAATKDIAE